jgi:hypothetical protein
MQHWADYLDSLRLSLAQAPAPSSETAPRRIESQTHATPAGNQNSRVCTCPTATFQVPRAHGRISAVREQPRAALQALRRSWVVSARAARWSEAMAVALRFRWMRYDRLSWTISASIPETSSRAQRSRTRNGEFRHQTRRRKTPRPEESSHAHLPTRCTQLACPACAPQPQETALNPDIPKGQIDVDSVCPSEAWAQTHRFDHCSGFAAHR